MSGVVGFDVVAGPAVIPDQPTFLGGELYGSTCKLSGIWSQQHVAFGRDSGQHIFEAARIAFVVLDHQIDVAVLVRPNLECAGSLNAETCELAGLGQACAYAQSGWFAAGSHDIATSYRNS